MKLSLLMLAILLSGCATKITVPIDQTALNVDKATLIIYHKQGFTDEFTVLLDRTNPIGIVTAEVPLKVAIDPGKHTLHTEVTAAIDRITEQVFEAGKTYYFKIWLDFGAFVSSIKVTPSVAVKSYNTVSRRDEFIEKYRIEP